MWAWLAALAAGALASASGMSGVLGKRYYHGAVFGSHRLAGALYANLIYSRRLPRHDALFFATGLNWTVTLLGFMAGNCVGFISEYSGRKLSEATSKERA